MPLPRLIEYIRSLPSPKGGVISEEGAGQIRYTAFAPNTTGYLTISPGEQEYAYIGYHVYLSPRMVPDAFTASIQQLGHTVYSGPITDTVIAVGVPAFGVVTEASPVFIVFTNVSGLVQYAEVIYMYLLVRTPELYDVLLQGLADLAGKTAHADALELANLMKAQRPLPSPIGGRL